MLEDLLTHALDGFWIVDEDGIICYLNPAAEGLSGYSAAELIGQPLERILPPEVAKMHAGYLQRYAAEGPQYDIMGRIRDFAMVAKDGEVVPIGLRAFEIPPQDGKRCFGAIMQDYRPRRALEAERAALLARLEAQALSDELTGLPNRRAWIEELQRVQAAIRRNGQPAAVAILDIDHFKRVNDTFGHPGGDQALRALAKIFRAALRGEDFLARIGGEEFALVLRGADAATAEAIAERMRREVEKASILLPEGGHLHMTVSIGVAPLPSDGSLDGCLAASDRALYRAKNSGRNRVCLAYEDGKLSETG